MIVVKLQCHVTGVRFQEEIKCVDHMSQQIIKANQALCDCRGRKINVHSFN